ncbi:MAG TPA: 16S rRNA (guanine(527)-N(7))-methyltransferase RsmG [Firmicutes bacterium]|nr:16S rRNA (guanine(527)-N(7))-methyltransferase RsmG [Bacillota bacterium]
MIDKKFLQEQAAKQGFSISDAMAADFDQYAELLIDWNTRMNLTAITDPVGIVIKHFMDSLLLLDALQKNACSFPAAAKLIDVGAGAGFPSVPVRLYRPDLQITQLDSLQKRVVFLQAVSDQLGLSAQVLHMRAEEGGKHPDLREKFDLATARAVANLRELSEYCLPFVKPGGYFVALKGYDVEEELAQAEAAIRILGGQVQSVSKYTLSSEARRSIVILQKISQTPPKYPRIPAKIAKNPL